MTINKSAILIIDDNEDIITMVKMMLEMKGYGVTVRMNTSQIEDVIREVQPDLIIMDMLLSGADGRVLCKDFKTNTELSHITVMMMSAHPNALHDCLHAGADTFLAKPFEIQHFYDSVEKSLLLRKAE